MLIILFCFWGFAGCGGDSTTAEFFYLPIGIPPTRLGSSLKFDANGLSGREPKPVFPDKPPPPVLYGENLIDGIGTTAHRGDRVTVEIVGYDYETRQKFYSSWDVGKPLTFTVGAGESIEGLDRGIPTMEIGDAREMIVPPRLAVGADRLWGAPANSTLALVVVLLSVRSHPGI
jgi:hypothetical protein